MRISDWSSDVCSSDLLIVGRSSSSRFAPFRRKSTDRSTDRESAEGLHGDRHEISRPTARSVRRGICRSSEMALNKLSARKVETLSKPGWYNDGGGLYLRITEGRPTKWVYIFKRDTKRREMGLDRKSVVWGKSRTGSVDIGE